MLGVTYPGDCNVAVQIRDPVHNFIELREKEQQLLDTPALQRLRRIRQLALASLVYPGALHTRFDHSLGVMHVAGQMAETLELDPDSIANVRLAALLHDIGHGPFSHVSEYALERYANRAHLRPDQKKEKIHELVTGIMIANDPELDLGKADRDKFGCLLATGYGESILRQIVSGPLDADKQDYLLRDSYFCGVQYGVYDLRQLHRSLVSVADDNDNHELMIKADGIHAVEQYVLAKYYLTTNVYRHKVRLITDQMIVRAIVLGIERDNLENLRQLYSFDNTAEFATRYAEWDDARFLQTFGAPGKHGKCNHILTRLAQQKLFKRVFSGKTKNDFLPEVRDPLLELVKIDPDPVKQKQRDNIRKRIEASIAEAIHSTTNQKIDPDFVIYHAFDIKSVKEMSRNDETGILVNKRPRPSAFEDESSLFQSIQEGFNDEFIEVYAPVTWTSHPERNKLHDELHQKIVKAIETELAAAGEGAAP